ncbi:uncharacterized protein GGS25DRAFT_521370 [Hypoxylon fragiforme]|uniref:uncharacterized protein n=1 Tax=Hypoxylon fragiforme TaxID=63214 RepID=UPI0020C69707|nr:uncharacterized protein GGS25DRAFT_521370 [Hypoxylon fragiforme]KAI2608197.1 hypothetical protein GGS25DRAFT_521370 [Hypoxylon fragiforme]
MPREGEYYFMHPGHVTTAAIALSVLDVVAVALRFWARRVQSQPPKTDDWLMIPAMLLTVGISISQVYGVAHMALGYRIQVPPGYTGSTNDLVTPQLTLKAQIEWSYLLMFPIALGCMKASFLFFYMRVFAVQKHGFINKLLLGFIVVVVVWALAFFFLSLFECDGNFGAIWGATSTFMKKCGNTELVVLALCITDFITDVFIMAIPVPLVMRLQLPAKQKIAVCSMFLLGGGTVIASLVRFILMAGTYIGGINITSDNILGTTACMYWGMVECGIGVFAACLPAIRFLFQKWVWEPAVNSTKSKFSSQSSGSIEAQKNVIHVDHSYDVAYRRINSSGQSTSSV